MALLDFQLPGMDTPEGQGLLSAAFSLLQARKMPGERGIGGALGAAGQQYMGARSQAQEQMQRKKMQDLQMQQHQEALLAQQRAQQRQQAQDAEAARIRSLVGGAGQVRPGMGGGLPDGTLPPELSTGQTFQALQQPGQIDYQSLYRQGVPLEMLKGLAEAPNLGRQEVARTMKGMVGGREVDQQFDKFGQPVGTGMEQYKAPIMLDRGGQTDALSPYLQPGQSFPKTMTFGDKIAQGQLGVSQGNLALSRQKFAFDQAGGVAGTKGTVEEQKKVADAKDVLAVLSNAEGVLKNSTSSYIGAGMDQLARGIGYGTTGANAAAKLKALEGLLVSKMPKMSGPQSDKDVLLYKQMAGQIGDSTLPISTRQSAIDTIREINQRYAGEEQAKPQGAAVPDWVFKDGKLVKG